MKRFFSIITIIFTVSITFHAGEFDNQFRYVDTTYYFLGYPPTTSNSAINFLYCFNKDGTGWLMTQIDLTMFTTGNSEPIMSYDAKWDTFNDTLKISLYNQGVLTTRQFFTMSGNADTLFQISEYPNMRLIKPIRVAQTEVVRIKDTISSQL